MTDLEYNELMAYGLNAGARHGLCKSECEDIVHDAIIKIYEQGIVPCEWKTKVSSELGNYFNNRRRNRETVSLEDITY